MIFDLFVHHLIARDILFKQSRLFKDPIKMAMKLLSASFLLFQIPVAGAESLWHHHKKSANKKHENAKAAQEG
jgi:hypothetical protein